MTKSLLIFDLDGTLVDSMPDIRTATNKVLSAHQRREISAEECRKFIGNGAPKLIERAFRATGDALSAAQMDDCVDEFLTFYTGHEADESTLYDGVIDSLKTLQAEGFKTAVCTNKPQDPAINLIKDMGLEPYIDLVLGGDQLDHKKPHPAMMNWVLDKMGVSCDQAIMIGDSPNDIECAREAGVVNIAVPYGYRKITLEEMGADYTVENFPQIIDIIHQLSK